MIWISAYFFRCRGSHTGLLVQTHKSLHRHMEEPQTLVLQRKWWREQRTSMATWSEAKHSQLQHFSAKMTSKFKQTTKELRRCLFNDIPSNTSRKQFCFKGKRQREATVNKFHPKETLTSELSLSVTSFPNSQKNNVCDFCVKANRKMFEWTI